MRHFPYVCAKPHYYKNDTLEYARKEKLKIRKRGNVCYVTLLNFEFKTSRNIKDNTIGPVLYHWTGDALSLYNLDYDFYKID